MDLTNGGLTRIDATSRIDVSQRGYLGAQMAGNGVSTGRTVGDQPGSTARNGGSYGGLGANGSADGQVNPIYGDFREPFELGSGGGSDSGSAGSGGGRVRLRTDQLLLDGAILANGANGSHYGGGGSGGAIYVQADIISGSGRVSANGGNGAGASGGGGGGRIALFYSSSNGSVLESAEAIGGSGVGQGAAGTIIPKVKETSGFCSSGGREGKPRSRRSPLKKSWSWMARTFPSGRSPPARWFCRTERS